MSLLRSNESLLRVGGRKYLGRMPVRDSTTSNIESWEYNLDGEEYQEREEVPPNLEVEEKRMYQQ